MQYICHFVSFVVLGFNMKTKNKVSLLFLSSLNLSFHTLYLDYEKSTHVYTMAKGLVSSCSVVSTEGLDKRALTLMASPKLAAINFLNFCRAHILWAAPVKKQRMSSLFKLLYLMQIFKKSTVLISVVHIWISLF